MSSAKAIKSHNPDFGKEQFRFKNLPKIQQVAFIKNEIAFVLDDERVVYIPISWSQKLLNANDAQRMNFINTGIHVFWDDIDEIIGIKNILLGNKLFL